MDFVYDIYLELGLGWWKFHIFPKFADVVHAGIAGSIDFKDVQGSAIGDVLADIALKAWRRAVRIHAVDASGKDAGHGRLARSSRTSEEISMSNPAMDDGVGEGLHDVRLPDDIGESDWAIFSIK